MNKQTRFLIAIFFVVALSAATLGIFFGRSQDLELSQTFRLSYEQILNDKTIRLFQTDLRFEKIIAEANIRLSLELQLPDSQSWISSHYTIDQGLRPLELSLSDKINSEDRKILELLNYVLSPTYKDRLAYQKSRSFSGLVGWFRTTYEIDPKQSTILSKREHLAKLSSLSQTLKIEGQFHLAFGPDGLQFTHVQGEEIQTISDGGGTTETLRTKITLVPTNGINPSHASPKKRLAFSRYDAFTDRRITHRDRITVWEETMKKLDASAQLAKLNQNKIETTDKAALIDALTAKYSLHPELLPELEVLIAQLSPNADGFHLGLSIIANLRVSEVNDSFLRLAEKFASNPQALETLALYFNDLQFPDVRIFSTAVDHSQDLTKKADLRFALAVGSMASNSQSFEIKTRLSEMILDRLRTSAQPIETKVWLSSLGNTAYEEALTDILALSKNPDSEISTVAINALRKFPYEQIKDRILEILEEGERHNVIQLLKIFRDSPPPREEWLKLREKLMNSTDPVIRERASSLDRSLSATE